MWGVTETRRWFWIQIAVAIALVVFGLAHYVVNLLTADPYLALFSYFMVQVGAFVFLPGLAISIVVNAFVIRAHGRAGPGRAEKVLLVFEAIFILATLAFHLWLPFLFSPGMWLWLLLVIWAIVVVIVAGIRNASIPPEVRRGAPRDAAAVVAPPPPPGVSSLGP
jgi:hypothetical protein